MAGKTEYMKKYVTVGAYHTPEGKTIPKFLIIDDEHKIIIDRLVTSCRAAATKVGGTTTFLLPSRMWLPNGLTGIYHCVQIWLQRLQTKRCGGDVAKVMNGIH